MQKPHYPWRLPFRLQYDKMFFVMLLMASQVFLFVHGWTKGFRAAIRIQTCWSLCLTYGWRTGSREKLWWDEVTFAACVKLHRDVCKVWQRHCDGPIARVFPPFHRPRLFLSSLLLLRLQPTGFVGLSLYGCALRRTHPSKHANASFPLTLSETISTLSVFQRESCPQGDSCSLTGSIRIEKTPGEQY